MRRIVVHEQIRTQDMFSGGGPAILPAAAQALSLLVTRVRRRIVVVLGTLYQEKRLEIRSVACVLDEYLTRYVACEGSSSSVYYLVCNSTTQINIHS